VNSSLNIDRLPIVTILIICILSFAGVVAASIWQERDLFLTGEGRPRSRKMMVTVLFPDLKGFTSTSESLDLVQQRVFLLEQVGLSEAAQYENKRFADN